MNKRSHRDVSVRRTLLSTSCAVLASACLRAQAPIETIGPWSIRAAPISATVTGGGGGWLNVVNTAIDTNAAFSGVSIVDDGEANVAQGSVYELTFAGGVALNASGDDLVMFDGRYSLNDYAISTDYDNFVLKLQLPNSLFSATGVSLSYYYSGNGPYQASVMAAPIDLSTLGVPVGAAVTRVRFRAVSSQADPLGIGVLCNPTCAQTYSYCTAGTSTNGCVASITADHDYSIAHSTSCHVSVIDNSGFTPVPWSSGSNSFLCVKSPSQRTGAQISNGNYLQCNGVLALDFNAYATSHPGALGQPYAASQQLFWQAWFRDPPAPKTTNLSNALAMTVVP
jgi:hypothetical protein